MIEKDKSDKELIAELAEMRKCISEMQVKKNQVQLVKDQLNASEEKFKILCDFAPISFQTLDDNGNILDVSSGWLESLCYTREEVIGKNFSEFLHPDWVQHYASKFPEFKRPGYSDDISFCLRRKGGQDLEVSFNCRAWYLPDGSFRCIYCVFKDVSQEKQTEAASSRQKYFLEKAQELGRIGTWELDLVNNILRWTDENCRIFGVPPGSVVNYEVFISKVHPDDRDYVDQEWMAGVAGKPYDIEHRLLIDGVITWVREKAEVEFNEEGVAINAIGFTQDITQRKEAEEARIQAEDERLVMERKMLHSQKLESLGILAGGIAHDFNNLLMCIMGNSELAIHNLSPMSPALNNLREIEEASKRAADLANQMLAYSGRGRFVIESLDCNAMVTEMMHLLEVSVSKKIHLIFNGADGQLTFDGDAGQIRQIIMNLIVNASEAIGDNDGVIALSTGMVDCDESYFENLPDIVSASLDLPLAAGRYVFFKISDTGCGMAEETIENIFDPFYTTKFTGRGLGLSAVLGIVRGHHGALDIRSEIDKGTTFKVIFPANEMAASPDSIGRQDFPGQDIWSGNGTILIADDEPGVCNVARQMLESLGFSVMIAPDGWEAVRVFRENSTLISCVLLDLTMPHMDGRETYHELLKINPETKVILCSGYSEQEATQQFKGDCLAGFIQKPFSMAALKEMLIKVFPKNVT